MKEFFTYSDKETEDIAAKLAIEITANGNKKSFIAMYGGLGVGKTAFTRGLALALGIHGVKSPTYAIVNEYSSCGYKMYHFDMYRISDPDDLYSTGFYDYIEENAVIICEWSENIESEIPADAIKIKIEKTYESENARKITLL